MLGILLRVRIVSPRIRIELNLSKSVRHTADFHVVVAITFSCSNNSHLSEHHMGEGKKRDEEM